MYDKDFKPTSIKHINGVAVMLALLSGALISLSLNVMLFIGFMGIVAILMVS